MSLRSMLTMRASAMVLKRHRENGETVSEWLPAVGADDDETALLAYFPCRVDTSFIRVGRDTPAAPVAGGAPDRVGVLFYENDVPLKAGMRIVMVPNDYGDLLVSGTFEMKAIPDGAIGYGSVHHMEVQVFEVQQALSEANWPDAADESSPGDTP